MTPGGPNSSINLVPGFIIPGGDRVNKAKGAAPMAGATTADTVGATAAGPPPPAPSTPPPPPVLLPPPLDDAFASIEEYRRAIARATGVAERILSAAPASRTRALLVQATARDLVLACRDAVWDEGMEEDATPTGG